MLEMAVDIVEIQEQYTRRAVRAVRMEESEVATHLKVMGEKLEALPGPDQGRLGTTETVGSLRESN